MTEQDARQTCIKALERTEADMLAVAELIAHSPDPSFTDHLSERLNTIDNGRIVLKQMVDQYNSSGAI